MKLFFALSVAMCAAAGMTSAQDAANGEALFRTHCAMCHGLDAKGSGPMAPSMTVLPVDLTQLEAGNDGVLPIMRIVRRIDGRDPLVSHGSSMPVYGPFFAIDDVPMRAETGQPIMASTPIVDLVAYLETIQN